MCFIANSAGGTFKEWGTDKVADHIFLCRESTAAHMIAYIKNEMDVSELSDEEFTLLGFNKWDDKGDWLIPVWLYSLLPNGTKLYCPIADFYEEKSDDTDDTDRFGCVGFSFDIKQ